LMPALERKVRRSVILMFMYPLASRRLLVLTWCWFSKSMNGLTLKSELFTALASSNSFRKSVPSGVMGRYAHVRNNTSLEGMENPDPGLSTWPKDLSTQYLGVTLAV